MLETAIEVLPATLAHALWQGCVIAMVGWWCLRSHAPTELRCACATALLVGQVAVSVATFVVLAKNAGQVPLPSAHWAPAVGPRPLGLGFAISCVWATGAAAMALRTCGGFWHLIRLRRRAQRVAAELHARTQSYAQRLGLTRKVEVGHCDGIDSPLCLGVWRPLIVLPTALIAGAPSAVIEAALLHELAHLRRHDPLLMLVQSIVESLFFFHPAIWWLSREARGLREHCCDEIAATALGDALGYARALTALERTRHQPHLAPAMSGAQPFKEGILMQRIKHILAPPKRSLTSSITTIALTWTALVGTPVIIVACEQDTPEADEIEAIVPEQGAASEAKETPDTLPRMPEQVRQHRTLFVEAAETHNINPQLLAIVTLIESRGKIDALSPMGARGLMQIMPATGELIAQQRGLAEHSTERLDDPAYNVDFGAYYLAELAEDIDIDPAGELDSDDVGRLAAAYNAGPKRARAHFEQGTPLPAETERYIATIQRIWSAKVSQPEQ